MKPRRDILMKELDLQKAGSRSRPDGRRHGAVERGGRPARIMLAEDDAEMRTLISSALRADGYEVIEAADGRQLFEAIGVQLFRGEAVPADLIISDHRMPGMPGLEVLTALRRVAWKMPFILITAFGDGDLHREAVRLGARAVFDKPFDLDDLRGTVLEALAASNDPT